MKKDESKTNWSSELFSQGRQRLDKKQPDLQGEDSIRALIATGAPLPHVLNVLCAAIDRQIGNIVSVLLVADEAEHDLQTIADSALQFGLHVFWSASIPLSDENLLGYFEVYSCVPRAPSLHELQLIQRVTEMAAQAIQHHHGEPDLGRARSDWESALQRRAQEAARLN